MSIEDRLAQGIEIKETISKAEIAFAFLKPDSLEDLPEIEKILNEHGLEIIYQEKVQLSGQTVDEIYKESKGEHFYEAMKDYLTKNDVIVLLVGGPGHEAQKILLNLKKDGGKNGIIREKFQKIPSVSKETMDLWQKGKHPQQDEVSVIITQKNVIHTADSTEEALNSLKLILGPKFEDMKKKGNLPAELWDLFDDENKKQE